MSNRKYTPGTTVKIWCVTYWHFGLVDLTGLRVIHNSKKHRKVVRESIAAFASGSVIIVCDEVASLDPHGAVKKAELAIGLAYDLWTRNCEHFVRWAHGLEPASPQLQRALATAAGLAMLTSNNLAVQSAGAAGILASWLVPKGSSPGGAAVTAGIATFALCVLISGGG